MIHLDTSFVVDLLRELAREEPGPATKFFKSLPPREEVRISVFVVCELMSGVVRAENPEAERGKIQRLREVVPTVYPDERFPEAYAAVLSDLYRRRLNVDNMDLLIATTALADGARLVTGNVRHFSHISDLEVLSHKKSRRQDVG